MEWGYSKEETMLKKTANEFLKNKEMLEFARGLETHETGYSEQIYQGMAKLDWMRILIPEKYDGLGMGFKDLAIILEEMGRFCYTGPFFSTVVLGSKIIGEIGSENQKDKYLPQIGDGKLKLAFALYEENASYDLDDLATVARAEGNSYVLNGKKMFVTDAQTADAIICVAKVTDRNHAINFFMVNPQSKGVHTLALDNIAKTKMFEINFENVEVPADNLLGDGTCRKSYLSQLLSYAAVAKCCEMVGGMKRALELTIEHAKIRVQGGGPKNLDNMLSSKSA